MPNNSLPLATFRQRALASLINLTVLILLGLGGEMLSAGTNAGSRTDQAVIATKALFGLWILFWLGCGQFRSSPGLALLKLRVVSGPPLAQRISLATALFRPLPHALFLATLAFPVQLLPRSFTPIQFLLVLLGALSLAANSTPLWSAVDRRSLVDKWLNNRVISR